MIRPETARQLGYQWHGGQSSPLYAFASSGQVDDRGRLLNEIRDCRSYSVEQGHRGRVRDLDSLAEFVAARLEADDGMLRAPWAWPVKPETGQLRIFTPDGKVRERHHTMRGVIDYARRRPVERVAYWRLRPGAADVRVRLTFADGCYSLFTMPDADTARAFCRRQWPAASLEEVTA